jgi:hypothetical protein
MFSISMHGICTTTAPFWDKSVEKIINDGWQPAALSKREIHKTKEDPH